MERLLCAFEQIEERDDAEEFLIGIDDEGFADGAAHEGLDEVGDGGFGRDEEGLGEREGA